MMLIPIKAIVIGLAVGFVQGYLFSSILIGCYKYSAYRIARITSSFSLAAILGSLFASIGVGSFMVGAFIPLMWITSAPIRHGYGLGWLIGFFIGAFIYVMAHRNQTDKPSRMR
jgi:hypothetical protein